MKKLLFIPIALMFLVSCESEADKAAEKAKQDSITKIESRKKYYEAVQAAQKTLSQDKMFDKKKASDALRAYSDFFTMFPEDSLAPEYLFRAGQLAEGFGNYQQAGVYYETVIEKHKGYKRYPDVVFAAALMYDTYLEKVNHGDDRAKQLYNFVISNYPGTRMAEDAKVMVQYVGLPDSVMINDILKKAEAAEKK